MAQAYTNGLDNLETAFSSLVAVGRKASDQSQFKDAAMALQLAANVAVTMHQLGSGIEPIHHILAEPIWGDQSATGEGEEEED